jgi:DNA repair ATPase RecN
MEIVQVLIWPIAFVAALFIFRQPISDKIVKIGKAKFIGQEVDFLESSARNPENEGTVKAEKLELTANIDRVGSVFWLGHDLFWTFSAISTRQDRSRIVHGLRHARHHLSQLELSDSKFEDQINQIIRDISSGHSASEEKLQEIENRLNELLYRVGGYFESYQAEFKASPDA